VGERLPRSVRAQLRGALGKYIIVVPERDLVVVYQNHTEFPDDAAAYSPDQSLYQNVVPGVSRA
jgi:hypothetical protein